LACVVFEWDRERTIYTMMASLLLSAPALVSVNTFYWLLKKISLSTGFVWMVMMASVPVMVAIPALVFVNEIPGDSIFLLALGVLSCYAGILGQGNSIARLFESIRHQQ
ncbi:MAG TPA: hypothetical protein VGC29_01520, partial [Flavisolibacter sp.]